MVRWRVTPLYSFLEETDFTCAYDRWNVIVGPWFYEDAYDDPWYARPQLFAKHAEDALSRADDRQTVHDGAFEVFDPKADRAESNQIERVAHPTRARRRGQSPVRRSRPRPAASSADVPSGGWARSGRTCRGSSVRAGTSS